MSNRKLYKLIKYRLIKFSKYIFVDLIILGFGVVILRLARHTKSASSNFEANNIIFLGTVPIPKLILVLLSMILGFGLIVLALNIISQKFVKVFKKRDFQSKKAKS
jgi:hypothetical protein